MISRKLFILLLLFIIPAVTGFAENTIPDTGDSTKEDNIKKVAVLPFMNYTDSGMKYLSYYIPELMKKDLSGIKKKIEILDAEDLRFEMKKRGLSADLYNDPPRLQAFLQTLHADLGISGRYLIHEKTIKIDYYLIYAKSGQIIPGQFYDGVLDERLLSVLDKFALNRMNGVRGLISGESYFQIGGKKQKIIESIKNKIKRSPVGPLIINRWVGAAAIILLFFILSKITVLFFEKVLNRITAKTATDVDDKIIEVAKKPVKWIVLFLGIRLAALSLAISGGFSQFLSNLVVGVIILFITYILMSSSSIMIHSWGKKITGKLDSRIDDDLVPLFSNISKILIVSIGALMVLSQFEVDVAPLIASLGIAGFAIGFAVKDSLSNIIGGIVLILDHSFAVGDKVSIEEDTGIILEVGLRNTKLQTFDNEIIVIPNGELMNKKFKNYVLPDPKIRVVVKFGVAYGSDIDQIERVVLEAVTGIDDICTDPGPAVVFTEMGDFALSMEAKFFVPEYLNQYSKWLEGTKRIYNALNSAGIDIPFPTQTVYLRKEDE